MKYIVLIPIGFLPPLSINGIDRQWFIDKSKGIDDYQTYVNNVSDILRGKLADDDIQFLIGKIRLVNEMVKPRTVAISDKERMSAYYNVCRALEGASDKESVTTTFSDGVLFIDFDSIFISETYYGDKGHESLVQIVCNGIPNERPLSEIKWFCDKTFESAFNI